MGEKTQESWTVGQIIEWSTKYLASKSSDSPRLDAELLLSESLRCKRIDLYLTYDKPLKREERECFKELLQRRSKGEPVAYILGRKEFLGREFIVSSSVLIPRPETELMVEEAISILKNNKSDESCSVLDIGTGSGCIIVSLALTFPSINVVAWDKSEEALDIAKQNAEKLNATNVVFECRDVLNDETWNTVTKERKKFNVIISNPPYISENEMALLSPNLNFEPKDALVTADDGFQIIKLLSQKVASLLHQDGHFLIEIGARQGQKTCELMAINGWKNVSIRKDYAGHDRFVICSTSELE